MDECKLQQIGPLKRTLAINCAGAESLYSIEYSSHDPESLAYLGDGVLLLHISHSAATSILIPLETTTRLNFTFLDLIKSFRHELTNVRFVFLRLHPYGGLVSICAPYGYRENIQSTRTGDRAQTSNRRQPKRSHESTKPIQKRSNRRSQRPRRGQEYKNCAGRRPNQFRRHCRRPQRTRRENH